MADEQTKDDAADTGTDSTAGEGQVDKTTDSAQDNRTDGSKSTDEVDEVDYSTFEPEVRSAEEVAAAGDDEDDSIDEDDRKALDSRIQKHLTPIQKQIQKQNNEIEVNTFLGDNPEFSKYKPAIMKYISHPVYSKVPVDAIAAIVSSKDQQRIGAAKERAAAKKVKETQAGGSQSRSTDSTGAVDIWAMPKAEFEAYVAKSLSQVKK